MTEAPAKVQDGGEEPVEDFAQDLQLYQSFPVLQPLSNKTVGPQDCRTPAEVWGRILEKEQSHDTWLHTRERQRAAHAQQQHRTRGFREKAEAAEKSAVRAVSTAAERLADLEKAVAERKKKQDDDVRAMRNRLQLTQELEAEVRRECQSRVHEMRSIVPIEQEHTQSVQARLEQERQHTAMMRRRVEEAEEAARRDIAARDKEIEAVRAQCKERVERAMQIAEERVAEVKVQCEEKVKVIQNWNEDVKGQCAGRHHLEVVRKDVMSEVCEEHKKWSHTRQGTDSHAMKRHVVNRQDDCESMVARVQDRDVKTEEYVKHKVDNMTDAFARAGQKKEEAQLRIGRSADSVQQAACILGQHYSSRHQYNPTADGKLSYALQGCSHGSESMELGPAPAPRAQRIKMF